MKYKTSVAKLLEAKKDVSRLGEMLKEMEEAKTPISLSSKVFDFAMDWNQENEKSEHIEISEFLTSDDASVLMPRIVYGALREGAEPQLIMSQFFQKIRLVAGTMIDFPTVSAMRADDIPEGTEYPKATVDFTFHRNLEIRVGKYGLSFGVTDEAVRDSLWDVIGILTRNAGRAMARWEEQKRANAFHMHAQTRFDGSLAETSPAHPTGYGFSATATPGSAPVGTGMSLNDTLSTMDWIDLFATLMANDFTPTDVLMHPLYWPSYAKTLYYGGLGNMSLRWNPSNVPMGPEAIGRALPFAINPVLTPRIYFHKAKKVGELYIIDRNEVGVELIKDEMSQDEWNEPAKDIRHIKIKARKGWGILNKGRAIIAARNISAMPSYDPTVQFVHQV